MDDAVAAFLARIDMQPGADACWPWLGSILASGYGQVWWGGRPQGAHRVAVMLADGAWPAPGLVVRHLCHNRVCCRPVHLRVGTHQDNSDDMVAAGRQRGPHVVPGRPVMREPRGLRQQEEALRLGFGTCGRRATDCGQAVDGLCMVPRCILWRG